MKKRLEDLEHRAHSDHHLSLKLWLRLLSCVTLIEDDVRQNLRHNFNTTLARFDLLAQLERCPKGLTMTELSRRMMVTGGNITLVVDQLEKEKLVKREVSQTDRRSYRVLLTGSGRKVFTQMASQHENWIVELLAGLTESQQKQIYELLGILKTKIHLTKSISN